MALHQWSRRLNRDGWAFRARRDHGAVIAESTASRRIARGAAGRCQAPGVRPVLSAGTAVNPRTLIVCLAVALTYTVPAWCEDQRTTEQRYSQVPSAEPTSTANSGLFPKVGQSLLAAGIDLHGFIFEHFLANPSAGSIPGNTTNIAPTFLEADFDLQRLLGLTGGNLHVSQAFDLFTSNNPGFAVQGGGVLTAYQALPLVTRSRLNLLTYEQKLLDGKLSIEFGRTNAYRYFFLPNGLDIANQQSSAIYVDGNFVPYQFPEWGARATYFLTPVWYLQAGVFEDNFRRTIYNGNSWGVKDAVGAQLLAELNYRSTFAQERLPANMEVGFEWDTNPGGGTQKGSNLVYSPAYTAAKYPGGGVAYLQGQKVIWAGLPNGNGPPKNIALYGSAAASVSKPQPVDFDAMIGTTLTGFLSGRPLDAFGLQARYQRLSQIEANFETRAQTISGSLGTKQPRDNYAFEAIYNAQLRPWAALQPFVEYFTAADDYYVPFAPNRPHDGFMVGAYLNLSLGPLLGTSHNPF